MSRGRKPTIALSFLSRVFNSCREWLNNNKVCSGPTEEPFKSGRELQLATIRNLFATNGNSTDNIVLFAPVRYSHETWIQEKKVNGHSAYPG